MQESFLPLGKQSPAAIKKKLAEVGDEEAILDYDSYLASSQHGLESIKFRRSLTWLNTQHQIGFIPIAKNQKRRFRKIISSDSATANLDLKNQRINIRLDFLRIYRYPRPFISLGSNIHTILFTFEAQNQVSGGNETVTFNQTYKARSDQDAAVKGYPIFTGLNVGSNGILFSCKTINVGNSDDAKLVNAINSDAARSGLSLLTTAQPALAPFIGVAKGLCTSLTNRKRNIGVQDFNLGLDFDDGALGARLSLGSYVVVQVGRPGELVWSDWQYDQETGAIMRKNLAEGEAPFALPYNAIVFRVSLFDDE